MAEIITDRLRRSIVRGELAEGAALPSEAELMATFGVSRPTLREALRVLESEALIQVRRGARGGARAQVPRAAVVARYAGLVLQFRGVTLDDLYEARTVLEPPCVGLLAARGGGEAVPELRAALTRQREAGADPEGAVRAHVAFHALLVEHAGNQTLRLLMRVVEHIVDQADLAQARTAAGSSLSREASRQGLAAHRRVVDLIEARDVEGATTLWHRHLAEARRYLRRPEVRTVLDLLA
ncbi:FCD domain-containing protein [Pseudonocardia sp. NPDC049154]|uniref:FadR/GntR family transcriptional regulator n=1 Tax=Pseudonocardia sp. NPDC049154 TaxID=3155501 RepID=UPI0033EB93BD